MYEIPKVLQPVRIGGRAAEKPYCFRPHHHALPQQRGAVSTEDAISFFESRARAGVGMVTVAGLKVGKDVADDGQNTAWT